MWLSKIKSSGGHNTNDDNGRIVSSIVGNGNQSERKCSTCCLSRNASKILVTTTITTTSFVLFFCLFFLSPSESASLEASLSQHTPTDRRTPTGHNLNTNRRISRHQNQPYTSSYLIQSQDQDASASFRTTISKSSSRSPRVLLRLNSEYGILKPSSTARESRTTPLTTTTTTTSTITTTPTPLLDLRKDDVDAEEADYPYHFYLDFDDEDSEPQPVDKISEDSSPEESLPVASSLLYKSQGEDQNQNNIWSDYYIKPQNNPFQAQLSVDNYTIPSLRDYKFPGFKTLSNPVAEITLQEGNEENNNKEEETKNPSYNINQYSQEDLENVADLDSLDDQHVHYDHSKYFVKTKPRDVSSSSVANLYNSFYYEPPSYSTKTQPIPVKAKFPLAHETDKLINFFSNSLQFKTEVTSSMSPAVEFSSTIPTFPTTTPFTRTMTPTTITITPSNPSPEFPTHNYNYSKLKDDPPLAESILLSSLINLPLSTAATATAIPTSSFNPIIPLDSNLTPKTTRDEGTSIPGMPGIDYPIFGEIPITDFDCQNQRYKGFFADIETNCQAWHYCDFTDGQATFLCPNGTLFSQVLLTCDWWFNVNCKEAQQLYVLNERLYRFIKPPKPSFPEDYHGPQVDLWLLKQLELGLLPKIKKKGKLPPQSPPFQLQSSTQFSRPHFQVPTTLTERPKEVKIK